MIVSVINTICVAPSPKFGAAESVTGRQQKIRRGQEETFQHKTLID